MLGYYSRLLKGASVVMATTKPALSSANAALDFLYDRPGFIVRRAHQICMSMFAESCAGLDITPTQFGIMTIVKHCPGIDQISVARLLGHDRSTTMLVVRLLAKRGIIDKTSVEEDKRKNALSLTAAGETLWTQCDTVLTELKHTLAEPFSPGEREAFIYLLNKFNAAFNDRARTTLEGTDS